MLLYRTTSDTSSDIPLACLSEHTFGVRALAFSHDSHWLCSLGDVHDGGFFLWSIDSKTGHMRLNSSNRCTTAESIAWMGGSVVSVGTRHVKVWRLNELSSPSKQQRFGIEAVSDGVSASPGPKIFTGRNCLLGPLKDEVFTCVAGISECSAILCTQRGAICLLDDTDRAQRLEKIGQANHGISCITVDKSSDLIWIGDKSGIINAILLPPLLQPSKVSSLPRCTLKPNSNIDFKQQHNAGIVAIGCFQNRVIAVDDRRTLFISEVKSNNDEAAVGHVVKRMPAHNAAALGAIVLQEPNKFQSNFLTYCQNGTVLFWSWNGTCQNMLDIDMAKPLPAAGSAEENELRVLRFNEKFDTLVSGDKLGYLR